MRRFSCLAAAALLVACGSSSGAGARTDGGLFEASGVGGVGGAAGAATGGAAGSGATAGSGQYPTPNLVNNDSYETGWGSFAGNLQGSVEPYDDSSGAAHIERTTEDSYQGNYSVKISFTPNATNFGPFAYVSWYPKPSGDVFWVRWYFKCTKNLPTGQTKWGRLQTSSGASDGIFVQQGNGVKYDGVAHPMGIFWAFPGGNPGSVFNYIGADVVLGQWHSIEYERHVTDYKVRFWYDGIPTVPIPYPNSDVTTDGTFLIAGSARNDGQMIAIAVMRTINSSTVSGACYFDRFAVSNAGRIGP